MRLIRGIGLGWLATFVLCTAALAQSASVRDLWPQATAAAEGGDLTLAESRLSELINVGRSTGILRFPAYAESAISIARQAQIDGNGELAVWARTAATKLDPASPEVAFGAANMAHEQRDWGAMLTSVSRGMTNAARTYGPRLKAQMDLLVVLAITILAVAALFAILMFVRYRGRAVHDLSETFGSRLSPGAALALAWAILFLPLFLTLGPQWLGLWWLALFFGYASRSERIGTWLLLIGVAAAPLMVEWAAWKTGALTSPVIRAAAAGMERSYRPGTLRRLRELAETHGSDARMLSLLGTLEAQEGNEAEAMALLKRAIDAQSNIAGAHLNLGNLHFLNNDFIAAMSQYERAVEIRPDLAIAHYNHSVAAGELYRFDLQGQKIEEAKRHDRSRIERLLKHPPAQKIVNWNLPMGDAWQLHEEVAGNRDAREHFGNYATFDLRSAALNPLTIGAGVAALLSILLYLRRRQRGFAGSCVKCGRTFCSRCKSSRESATYCTQCIHIYLKRDGVSLETKRNKLEDVQHWQQRTIRNRRLFASIFPGAGHLFDGATVRGLIGAFLFAGGVTLAVLSGRLAPIASPSEPMPAVVMTAGIIIAVVVWLSFAIPSWRNKAAQG